MNTELLNKIKETKSTNEKIYLAVNGFTELEHEFMTECFNNIIYGISETNIAKAIECDNIGKYEDLGEFLEKNVKWTNIITSISIKDFISEIIKYSGNEQILKLKENIFKRVNYNDRPWYIRVLLKNPRIGMSFITYNEVRVKQGLKPLDKFYVKLCTLLEPEEFNKLDFPVFGEIKYDGERAIISCENGNISITSRNGNDITKQYPEVISIINNIRDINKIDNFILDGEIVSSSFNALQKRMNRLESNINTDFDINFVCFDIITFNGNDKREVPQSYRRSHLESFLGLKLSECIICHDIEELNNFYNKAVENKEEGIIIKDFNAKWALKDEDRELWYKVKPVYTSDLEIYKVEKGSGKNKDYINILHVKDKTGNIKTKVSSGITDEQRKLLTHMWIKEELIGKIVEVKYNQITDTNSLRHPRFIRLRFDKDYADELKFT